MPSLPRLLARRIAAEDASRPLWRHPFTIAAAALALTLGAVPFLPDGDDDQGSIAPAAEVPAASPEVSGAAGRGEVTPEMQAEIDRVIAQGASLDRAQGRTALARASVRCARFEGQRYCLGFGWTNQTPEALAARMTAPPTFGRESTGDLDPDGLLARADERTSTARAEAERAELTMAAQSVGKVWLLRHEIQGVELPADFAVRHPEIRVDPDVEARGGFGESYPTRSKILTSKVARAQNQTYWCGPATMQAIGWSSQEKRKNQSYWARRLGTTTAGTAITDMVRVVNNKTDYDDQGQAGPYVVLDISDFTFKQWYRLMMRHVHDYQAPVILHPVLLKQYYPYLDDDASGHFQVGRGFDQDPDGNRKIGYFEPWDQSRFDPSEPAIGRVQWRNAYKSYRANLDHFQHNLGV
jgi:hypothetical protein